MCSALNLDKSWSGISHALGMWPSVQRVRSTCLADQQCSTMFNKVCNVQTVKVLYSVQCPCKSCLGHSSNVRPNGQGTQYSHTAHTNSPPMCCCVLSAICCEAPGGRRACRLAHIVQLCDEVNADLMTGHGAHAFNQTYQAPETPSGRWSSMIHLTHKKLSTWSTISNFWKKKF